MNDSLADSVAIVPAPEVEPEPRVVVQSLDAPADVLVPVSLFLFVFATVMTGLWFRYRTRRLIQEERLRAMELRLPIPPEPRRQPGNPWIMPFLLMGAGSGLLLMALFIDHNGQEVALSFGLLSVLSGLGWVAALKMNDSTRKAHMRMAEQESEAYTQAMRRSGLAPETPVPPAPPAPPTFQD